MAIDIKVPIEELRNHTLFLATPMYGGVCEGTYAHSIANLAMLCTSYGIKLQLHFLYNESLIPRARNYCADEFMRSEAQHFLFIDADVSFNPHDVLLMMAMQYQEPELYDVVCGPYPKKCISWEKIRQAVNMGIADEDPNILARFVGDYVFNPKDGTGAIPLGEPSEVLESGTGYMMITRRTLEKYTEAFPQFMYKPDHVRTEHFDGSREIMMYFHSEIDPVSRRYLSEDYWFCQNVQKIGLKIWLCPWMQTTHAGKYIFNGSLADIASIGASPTANKDQLKSLPKKAPANRASRRSSNKKK